VTLIGDELKALDLESSKVIDLEMFVPRCKAYPVDFNSPYYLYPEGQMAVEAIRVIGAGDGRRGRCRYWSSHHEPARVDGHDRIFVKVESRFLRLRVGRDLDQ
jgi:hypothetical protein